MAEFQKKGRERKILAMVLTDKSKIGFSGAPVFIAESPDDQEKVAADIARALRGDVYYMSSNGVYLILPPL